MLREMKCVQRKTRVIPLRIDGFLVNGGTATKVGILEGSVHCSVTENSAGDYTFTFTEPFQRTPMIQLTSATDLTTVWLKAVSTTSFRVEQVAANQDTPVADGSFHVLVIGFDAVEQY